MTVEELKQRLAHVPHYYVVRFDMDNITCVNADDFPHVPAHSVLVNEGRNVVLLSNDGPATAEGSPGYGIVGKEGR